MNGALIKRRLGQYGLAWVSGFLLVLLGGLAAIWGCKAPFVQSANLLLQVALTLLTLGVLTIVVLTVLAREGLMTKLLLVVLALVLFLPLLWAPMLGAVAVAALTRHAVEYSGVYAQFRIVVSQLGQTLFSNSTRDAVWCVFLLFVLVIGFIALVLLFCVFLCLGV